MFLISFVRVVCDVIHDAASPWLSFRPPVIGRPPVCSASSPAVGPSVPGPSGVEASLLPVVADWAADYGLKPEEVRRPRFTCAAGEAARLVSEELVGMV